MTMSESPQWCQVRHTAIVGKMKFTVLSDADTPPTPASVPTISVRCLLGRGHTGPHQTSVRDEKVTFR